MNILYNILKIDSYEQYIIDDKSIKQNIINLCISDTNLYLYDILILIKYNNIFYLQIKTIRSDIYFITSYDTKSELLIIYDDKKILKFNSNNFTDSNEFNGHKYKYKKYYDNGLRIDIYNNYNKYKMKSYFYNNNNILHIIAYFIDDYKYYYKNIIKKDKLSDYGNYKIYCNINKYYYKKYNIYNIFNIVCNEKSNSFINLIFIL